MTDLSLLRKEIQQHPERNQPEHIQDILSLGYQVHVAYCEAGLPYVIPFTYHYDASEPEVIYLHGGLRSTSLNLLAQGLRASISVSLLDGLVYSRMARYHSMNYRSVVAFGQGEAVADLARKAQILEAMIERYYPGRLPGLDYQPTPQKHLEQTLVVALKLDAMTAKVRQGGANGPEDHKPFALGSSGLVGLTSTVSDWRAQTWLKEPFFISTDRSLLSLERLFELLKEAYWNPGLTPERLALRVKNSLCFGLYHHEHNKKSELIGFARIVHDGDAFAYVADVIMAPEWQRQGLGHWLMQSLQEHPVMQTVRWSLLSTRDAQAFYAKQGFHAHENPEKLMIYRSQERSKGDH